MVAVNYLWNPINDNIVREFDDAGSTIAEYTTEPDLYGNVVSQQRGGQTSYLHFDGQGNTTELTNDAGNVTDTIRYSAFGAVTERSGTTSTPFEFIGARQYYLTYAAGTYSVRRRTLVVSDGLWLSREDIFAFRGFSDYCYADNNPTNRIDPSGLQPVPLPRLGPILGPVEGGFPRIYAPPAESITPRPFIPRPAPPIMGPPFIEPAPRAPQPGDIPADEPIKAPWKYPGRGRIPDSDCPAWQLDTFTSLVEYFCKDPAGPVKYRGCTNWLVSVYSYGCDGLEDLAKMWENCCRARRLREERCFRGGDKVHREQIVRCQYQVTYCYYLLRSWPCPGYGPSRLDFQIACNARGPAVIGRQA